MTSAYYHDNNCSSDVIIFGGNIQRKPKFDKQGNIQREAKFDKHVVTETRVLKFGMC